MRSPARDSVLLVGLGVAVAALVFVAVVWMSAPAVAGPTASPAPPSVAPSPSDGSATGSPAGSGVAPPDFGDCGRIPPAPCARAIDVARAGNEADLIGTTRIVVDDTCSPDSMCDRKFPFDAIVVFVTVVGDTTGWYAFRVFGLDGKVPTDAERWQGEIPAHVVERLRAPQPSG